MRPPFTCTVEPVAPLNRVLTWNEINGGNDDALASLFSIVTLDKSRQFRREDYAELLFGPLKSPAEYTKEAKKVLYTLRDFPVGMDQLLTYAALCHAPNMIRRTQDDAKNGFFGYHIALLWDRTSAESTARTQVPPQLVGVSTLEKFRSEPNKAEITFFKYPYFDPALFAHAVKAYMAFGKKEAGYDTYILHAEKRITDGPLAQRQRGNSFEIALANSLGFKELAPREASAPNGTGKTNHVFEYRMV